jgi:hypothetical protein
MKMHFIAAVGFLLLLSQANAQEEPELKSQKEKLSYIIGMDIGNDLRKQSVDIDTSG